MRRTALLATAGVLSLLSSARPSQEPEAAPRPAHLFVLAGQSNMVGADADLSELDPTQHPRSAAIRFFIDGEWRELEAGLGQGRGFGPEVGFGVLMERFLGEPIGLIKVARGGTGLANEWAPGAELRTRLYAEVDQALAALGEGPPPIAGVLWMQGERDSRNPEHAKQYARHLEGWITALRAEFESKRLPFVAGRVNPVAEHGFPHVAQVREAIESCRARPYAYVDCDDLTKVDDELHYDAGGTLRLGERFAAHLAAISPELLVASDRELKGTFPVGRPLEDRSGGTWSVERFQGGRLAVRRPSLQGAGELVFSLEIDDGVIEGGTLEYRDTPAPMEVRNFECTGALRPGRLLLAYRCEIFNTVREGAEWRPFNRVVSLIPVGD
ncbi:MAG: sialate O-acetylesterase [Planctomycetota bacterium]